MAKNRQHQWEPVAGSEDLVKCSKCGTEVTAAMARRGPGPCAWGEKAGAEPPLDPERPPGIEPAAEEATEISKPPGPRHTDPPEYCNACKVQLTILPLNSRLDMVACNNSRCALYRERIRMLTKPVERGKRKRGNNN